MGDSSPSHPRGGGQLTFTPQGWGTAHLHTPGVGDSSHSHPRGGGQLTLTPQGWGTAHTHTPGVGDSSHSHPRGGGCCGWLHHYQPFSTPGTSLSKPPSVSQWNRPWEIWVATGLTRSRDMIFWWLQPHSARVICNVYDVNGSLYWDSHQLYICLHIRVGICTVATADAVPTGKVSCYNCISRLCPLPALRRWSASGSSALLLAKMGVSNIWPCLWQVFTNAPCRAQWLRGRASDS